MSSTSVPQGVSFIGNSSELQPQSPADQRWSLVALLTGMALLIGIYWNSFTIVKDFWLDDTYSHGWIIPLLAIFLMWCQRKPLGGAIDRDQENKNMMIVGVPLAVSLTVYMLGFHAIGWVLYAVSLLICLGVVFRFHEFEVFGPMDRWIGAGLVMVSLAIRLFGTYRDNLPIDRYTFLPAMVGVFLMVGGMPLIRRMWASILFLFFMMPIPSIVEGKLLWSLQRVAAMASTTILQVLGVIAHRTGSQIHVDGLEQTLEVVGACAGMRMVTIFSAMVIALVLIIERPWWEKLILLISALPIAIITNVIRITATALLYLAVEHSAEKEFWHQVIHDWAGLAMIGVAFGIMWFEYKVLSWLFVEESGDALHSMNVPGGVPTARS
ncbi:exosortase/archaeosortase family protein [Aeoliella mucimassa]|uniref:Transmembrane exosortase (Exosortase_EpsH) n=1 Tax=Aeoliella mucimassa TaxID=2527972 RepID=A0A518AGT5_9BACT|nr:exosortase/archaeosortase family protein [Aeoliella mucimassa]QDU53941.1 Transmembrane exosortase (Exosortase_EpsH) [Aeoliella mucimassa]